MAILYNTPLQPFIQPQPAQLISKLAQQQQQSPITQDQNAYNSIFQPQGQQPSTTQMNLANEYDVVQQTRRQQPQINPMANNQMAASQTNPIANFLQSSAVRPDFQSYFNQLQGITNVGTQATAAAQQQAAAGQQALFNSVDTGGFGQRVSVAQSLIGVPYVWGHQDRNGTDCSGLVYQVLNATGTKVPRVTAAEYGRMGTGVSLAQAVPGDVVYFDEPGATDHVGIYIGNGKMIDAPFTGANVRVDNVKGYTSIRRIGALKTGTTPMGINAGLGGTPAQNKELARQLLAKMGLSAQWNAFDRLEMSEAGYNNKAQNPHSTAYGMGQFLNSTWAGFGPKTSDPRAQLTYMLKYILGRYGSINNAWRFHQVHGWY